MGQKGPGDAAPRYEDPVDIRLLPSGIFLSVLQSAGTSDPMRGDNVRHCDLPGPPGPERARKGQKGAHSPDRPVYHLEPPYLAVYKTYSRIGGQMVT
jgi:hypothetical protein